MLFIKTCICVTRLKTMYVQEHWSALAYEALTFVLAFHSVYTAFLKTRLPTKDLEFPEFSELPVYLLFPDYPSFNLQNNGAKG